MRVMQRFLVVLIGLALLSPLSELPAAAAQQAPTSSIEQQLADLYVPIAYMRHQSQACATPPQGGEPYLPLPVDIVMNNPEILVRDAADGDKVLATGPTAEDLSGYGPTTYMDFPGDPRRPGCTYETHERFRISELDLQPTTYARVVYDAPNHRVALQYWFWYYFNDWNNTHEGDWEMIQILWDEVPSLEATLAEPPSRTLYAQHAGAESANWGDPKIQLEDGTHPLVYPAAGSHATFYASHTYLAWGEHGSGFGCDVSTGPSDRTPLKAVLVPNIPDPTGPFGWLTYRGRWGERQPSMFNGPVGPAYNSRWIAPWGNEASWRPASIVVPQADNTLGPSMTTAFCSITEAGSQLLIYTLVFPWLTLPMIAVVLYALWFFFSRSRSLFFQGLDMYRAHWRVFIGIGLIAIPIGIVFNLLQLFLIHRNPLRYMVSWFDGTAGARLTAVFAIGGVQQLAMLLIISPAVIQAVADIHRGQKPGVLRSYQLAAKRSIPIGIGALVMLVLAGIPLLLIVGIPVSLWLVVKWQFFVQVLIFDPDRKSIEAMDSSSCLVKGRWWRTLGSVIIFDLMATLPGIVVGFGLLTLGGTAVGFANIISSLLYSLTIPLAVIAFTLKFLEYRAEPTRTSKGSTSNQKVVDDPGMAGAPGVTEGPQIA